jgi:hypothetical protein
VAPSLGSDCYVLLIHIFTLPHLSVSLVLSPYLHKIPQIPPFIFFGAYCVRLLHVAYWGIGRTHFMLSVGWRIRYYGTCIGGFLWLSLNININPFRAINTIRCKPSFFAYKNSNVSQQCSECTIVDGRPGTRARIQRNRRLTICTPDALLTPEPHTDTTVRNACLAESEPSASPQLPGRAADRAATHVSFALHVVTSCFLV